MDAIAKDICTAKQAKEYLTSRVKAVCGIVDMPIAMLAVIIGVGMVAIMVL